MNDGHSFRHRISVQSPCALQQLPGSVQRLNHPGPAADFYGPHKLLLNLPVGDKHLARFFVIGQIAKMNQQCQHIILCPKYGHVILERGRIDHTAAIPKHCQDCLLQSVKVQVDIHLQCLVCLCPCPVALNFPPCQSIRHRFGIVDVELSHTISIIPSFHLRIIHPLPLTCRAYFLFCESEILPQILR